MDPNDAMLTDFKKIIHDAIVIIDDVLYREHIDSCSQLHSILSEKIVKASI